MLLELNYLWNGTLEFSNQTVNYALDGRRVDVHIHVRVLQGYEVSWDRVMVSLEDVTQATQARQQLALSEQYARDLFDYSPVSLWVEDFSGVKRLLDEVRLQGIRDFRVFISVHPEFVGRCMEEIRVVCVNQQTLSMFGPRARKNCWVTWVQFSGMKCMTRLPNNWWISGTEKPFSCGRWSTIPWAGN